MNYKLLRIICLFVFVFSCNERVKRAELYDVPSGGDFTITSTAGTFDTQKERNKTLFIFFGFTNCPHVCPTTLGNMKRMVKGLTEDERQKLRILFISVDNERDTLPILSERMQMYGQIFVGATASDEKLQDIQRSFGGRYSRRRNKDNEIIVDHSDEIYVINGKGEFVNKLPYDSTPQMLKDAFLNVESFKPLHLLSKVPRSLEIVESDLKCDLSKNPCSLKYKGQTFELDLSPRPLKINQHISIVLKTSGPIRPLALDLQGLQEQMGFVRPEFKLNENNEYVADLVLPACDIKMMDWFARVIISEDETLKLLEYTFKTYQ